MSAYRIIVTGKARDWLKKLKEQPLRNRITAAIDRLADNPFPPKFEKLSGYENPYRIRVGDYRILYEVNGGLLLVIVIRIGHRREVYR